MQQFKQQIDPKQELALLKIKYEALLHDYNNLLELGYNCICGLPFPKNQPPKIKQQQCGLFEAFFVLNPLQKNPIFKFPQNVKLDSTINRIKQFTFSGPCLAKQFYDDQQQTKKNQILFGTMGDELIFTLQQSDFENIQLSPIMKLINKRQRLYAFVFVKPVLLTKIMVGEQKKIEVEIAFCFLTKFPFRHFFFDSLFRLILQQLKFAYIKEQKQLALNVLQPILTILNSIKIKDFPIEQIFKNNLCEIPLKISSLQNLIEQDIKSIVDDFNQIDVTFFSKILHYYMVESHLAFVCSQRKILNKFLQILRILIYPLVWPFPIIYNLTSDLLPFLESPIPIIIAINKTYDEVIQKKWDLSNFIIIDINHKKIINESKEVKQLQFSIKWLAMNLLNNQNRKIQMFRKFMEIKLNFIKTGTIKSQLSEFDLQFMQTQMASDYLGK